MGNTKYRQNARRGKNNFAIMIIYIIIYAQIYYNIVNFILKNRIQMAPGPL